MKLLDIGSSPDHPLQSIFVDSLLGDGRAAGVIRRLKLSMQKTIFGETVQVSVTGSGGVPRSPPGACLRDNDLVKA